MSKTSGEKRKFRGVFYFLAEPFWDALKGWLDFFRAHTFGSTLLRFFVRLWLFLIRRSKSIPSGGDDVSAVSYEEMLAWWAVEAADVDKIVRHLRIEAGLFLAIALLVVLGLAVPGVSWPHIISAVVILPTCFIVTASRLWRADCLANRHYLTFTEWLRQ